MAVVQDGGILVQESEADMQKFFARKGMIHYVMMAMRPGVGDCIHDLEHNHYKPATPRNDLFVMRLIEWQDLQWLIVSIPESEKVFMERAAAAHGLCVRDGVVIAMLTGGSVQTFPVKNPNVFVLENITSHPIYKNGLF